MSGLPRWGKCCPRGRRDFPQPCIWHPQVDRRPVVATTPPSLAVDVLGLDPMLSIPATGPATGRSDLVVERDEDPATGPWQQPAGPRVTDHLHVRVLHNAPRTATRLQDLVPTDRAATLARIDMPPDCWEITGDMITLLAGDPPDTPICEEERP